MARFKVPFWLDTKKPDEAWLLENIPALKERRLFSRFIREGVSLMIHFNEWGMKAQEVHDLIASLRAGETEKLLTLFPHLRGKLAAGQGLAPTNGAGGYLMQSGKPALAPMVKAAPAADPDAIFDDFMAFIQ